MFNEGFEMTKEEARMLGKIHFKKIEIADEIFVMDVGGYIGESTKREIEHARLNNKNIRYYLNEIGL